MPKMSGTRLRSAKGASVTVRRCPSNHRLPPDFWIALETRGAPNWGFTDLAMTHRRHAWLTPILIIVVALLQGCSIRKMALRKAADALSGSGEVFSSDNDPELIGEALPFTLKLMESLLAEEPHHAGLLLSLASGFAQYSYAFVQQEAERLENDNLDRARELAARSGRLYERARNYGLRGLEVRHPGFTNILVADPRAAAQMASTSDVPLLYWSAAAWAGAVSQYKDDPAVVGDLPKVEALLYRALDLDPDWSLGTIHTLLITYEMSSTTSEGDPVERATRHFERALALSDGRLAAPFINYAESVCVATEDRQAFEKALRQALSIDPDLEPAARVENVVMQQRARWLLRRIDELFLPVSE